MWLSRQKLLLLAVCALAAATYGCSNVEQASSSGEAEATTDGAASSADSVGSIPEDLLAQEEKGQGTENAESADPFSDLKEKEKSADGSSPSDSLSLVENGEEKASDHAAGSGNMESYSVKSGDTLMKIAFSIYGDIDRWKDLQQWNPKIKKAAALSKGMKIKYEVPLNTFEPDQHAHTYVIHKGDTLANIADEVYGRKMKYKKLQGYNRKLIRNPNKIFAGFTIFYDITAKEIAEADSRRKERMAGGGGSSGGESSAVPEPSSLVPSAIAPPAEDFHSPAPIAVAPSSSGEVPAPASTNDMAPPPPPAPPTAN